MDNRYVIELRNRTWTTNIRPQIMCDRWTIGNERCDIPVPGCDIDTEIEIKEASSGMDIAIRGGCFQETEKEELFLPIATVSLLHVCSKSGNELFSITVHPDPQANSIVYDTLAKVPEDKPIVIGGNKDADVLIDHQLIRKPVATVTRHGEIWDILPTSWVPLGIYLNTYRISSRTQAAAGDFLSCIGFRLQFTKNGLLLSDDDTIRINKLHQLNISQNKGYPCLNRSPRQLLSKPTAPIKLQDPPAAPQDNKGNIVISLLPIVAMILLTIILRRSASSDNSMVLFSVLSMAAGAIGSVLTYLQTGKEFRKKTAKRKEEYTRYIADSDKKIGELRKKEHDILHSIYPDSKTELQKVRDFSSSLYDRRPTDADFLDIRLGYGRIRSAQAIQFTTHEVFEQIDDLNSLPKKISRKYEFSEDLPVYVQGSRANAFGIVGGRSQLAEILKVLALDVAIRQYSEDVGIYAFLPSFFQDELKEIRLLPHLNSLTGSRRSLAYDDESYNFLTEVLFREISIRQNAGSAVKDMPWIVAIVDTGLESIMRHPLTRSIPNAAACHILFVFLSESKEKLPQGCTSIVYLMNNVNMGLLSYVDALVPNQLFSYDLIPAAEMLSAAEKLAPVYCGESLLSTHLTGKESLFDMLQIRSAEDLSVIDRWNHADSTVSLAAPIGIRDNGEILQLDLHERGHGPHGLIGGTTGSGKSQVLISYLLSLASQYSPDDITIAVIDFKGGDIVKQLPRLPHIVGSITNLAKNEIERSLRSINAEKNRRMILFDQDHANVSNISEYTAAFRAGKVKDPLPHLLIIVDEFAELKSQYPDFLKSLISIARVGRSLGIHLILCTQKPGGGVVDPQIWSNSSFRLCLRVQSHEDSNEVIRSPLAAEIHEPGRGYLQSDQGLFELFQSGYSGVPEASDDTGKKKGIAIYQLDLAGRRIELYQQKGTKSAGARTQREAVLDRIIQAFQESGRSLPLPLCQEAIADIVPYESLQSERFGMVPVGWLDDPDQQAIHALNIDLIGKNTLIVGKSQMGKTNLLVVILRWLAENIGPSNAAVYALDFNTYTLKSMQELSVVGGVVTEREEERLKNLIKLLYRVIVQRRMQFDAVRVQNYAAYRNLRGDMPIIVVMIDNYAVFQELYNDQFGDDLLNLIRDGTSYGITFIVTVQHTSSMPYKLNYFFTQRIALPLSDKSDYAQVIDGCRLSLPDTPGRALVAMNRMFYEGQIFEAFSGKNEAQKVELTRAFVDAHNSGPRARQIPGVPDELNLEYLRDNYPNAFRSDELIFGMGFEEIEPVRIRFGADHVLSVLGGNDQQRLSVTEMMINGALSQLDHPAIYILDDAARPLRSFRTHPGIKKYCCMQDEITPIFSEIADELERRKDRTMLDDEAIEGFAPILVIVNSADLLRYISDDSELIRIYGHIAEDLSRMKAFFLFSSVPNKNVRYNSPELIRLISEDRKALLLCELSAVKTFDIMGSVVRNQGRPLGLNEAFLLNGDELSRIKLCTQ